MNKSGAAFDGWLRSRFVELNTELEELYFSQGKLLVKGDSSVDTLTKALVDEGKQLISAVLAEGETHGNYEEGFYLLGNVGMYMAACRRHEVDMEPGAAVSSLSEASILASRLGSALGVAPRFMATHLSTDNRAINGNYRSFTSLQDEFIFVDYNTLGVLAYKKAADALERILTIGVSNTITAYLLEDAKNALKEVLKFNEILDEKLDVDRFFYNVRPYYKSYKVGRRDYRGANAGDFAGINVVDLLLGLCSMNDPFYLDIVLDKQAYMTKSEQQRMQAAMNVKSLLTQFLEELEDNSSNERFKNNAALFIDVCDMHGKAYAFHHDVLVSKYIEHPAAKIPQTQMENLTASGPPLPVLLRSLEKLRDLRMSKQRDDIATRFKDLERLRALN